MRISDRQLKRAARGDLPAVREMLRAEPGLIDARLPGHNRTLLFEAARAGRTDLARLLLAAGSDPDVPGRYRHETFVLVSPYVAAVTRGHDDVAEILLEHGAVIDVFGAAYLGEESRLGRRLDADPDAAFRSQPEDTVWTVTPLHHALAGGQAEAARLLLAAGAPVARHARLLLDIACRRARLDLVELLVDAGAEPSAADPFSVVRSGSPEIVESLFRRGCCPAGCLPYAARGDKGEHPEWARALLDHGADVNETDEKGRTALHNAARAGFTRVIEVLLRAGADPRLRTRSGETALDLARRRKRPAAADLLRERSGATGGRPEGGPRS